MQDSEAVRLYIADKQNQDTPKIVQAAETYEALQEKQKEMQVLTAQNYDSDRMAQFIKSAREIVQSGDEQKIEEFRQSLFINGEADIYKLDHNAVDWFIQHGTPENLEGLNSLRNLYGLNTIVEPFTHADSDKTDAKRALFGGEISAVNQYLDKETGELNPHYRRKHSDAFFKFRSDMSREYYPEEYDFSQNDAWQKINEEGLHLPKEELAAYFAEKHMPIDTFKALNATDMIHFLLENRGIDIENGQTYKLKEFDPNAPDEGIREQYWKKIAANEKMVDCISNDLWRKGVPVETIEQIWENCRNFGTPTKGENGANNVFGLSLQIHHYRALKDGGQNAEDNFVVVIDVKKGKFNCHDNMAYNSHKPLHEYDNPCVRLYLDEHGNLTKNDTGCQVKVLTEPSAKQNGDERVVTYTGPDKCSCYIIDQKGNVRSADYTKQAAGKAREEALFMKALYSRVMSAEEKQ